MTSLEEAQKKGIVIGLKDVTPKILDRLDIDILLSEKPKTFNLFVLALEHLQDERESHKNKMGWFQIAGIHGLPARDWDGVKVSGGADGGYCPHGLPLFPTWHRPYLAMMEQTIYYTMLEIAKRFKDSKTHIEAAEEFRLPYWDYFRPRAGGAEFPGVTDPSRGITQFSYDFRIPFIFELETVMVYRPEDEDNLVETKNPLYSFDYPRVGGLTFSDWKALITDDRTDFVMRASKVRTVRRATTKGIALNNQTSDYVELNSILSTKRESGCDLLLNMFLLDAYKDWKHFSYAGRTNPEAHGSVESLHNAYHGLLGGEGHMSRVPVAAFDPVFWMHHCNIDRIIALWQAINPKKWFLEGDAILDKPLYPFRSPHNVGKKGFWTSADVQDIETFGYSYPELRVSKDPAVLLDHFLQSYGWGSQTFKDKFSPHGIPPDMKPPKVFVAPVFAYGDRTVQSIFRIPEVTIAAGTSPTKSLRQKPMASKAESNRTETASAIANTSGVAIVPLAAPVEVKEPSLQDGANKGLSEGPPNTKDSALLSGKPKGTEVLRQWFVDDLVNKSAVNGAFTIHYFIGNFPEDSDAYAMAPTLGGLTHIFSAPVEACDNCGRQAEQNLQVTSTNPITPMLHDYVGNGTLASLHPDDVVPFLRTNLHWRVVGINQQPKESGQVPGLEVSVSSSVAYFLPDRKVPEEIGWQSYPEITTGRAGGLDS
ncbi:MAG: hypothetical protein M1812_003721 [Candelaria pacifica]|nr:MAG: hypothetical protein M1812_003721 [Candelaria pacifica]